MSELLELIVAQTWQVTVLCVVANWLSRTILKNHPTLCYQLGLLVLIKSITPPLWASHCGVFSWVFHRVSDTTSALLSNAFGGAVQPNQLGMLMFFLWSAGATLSLVRTLITWHRIQRRVDRNSERNGALTLLVKKMTDDLGIRKVVRVVVTHESIGPAVIGVWRPVLILPAEVVRNQSEDEIRPILAHELLHVRRGDTWVAILETLVRSVWWFYPPVHRAADATSRAGEFCCDQEVLRERVCQPRRYAASLLSVIESKCELQPVVVRPGIRAEQVTRDRLQRILAVPQPQPRPLLRFGLLFLGLLVVLPGKSFVPADFDFSTSKEKISPPNDEVSQPHSTLETTGSTMGAWLKTNWLPLSQKS